MAWVLLALKPVCFCSSGAETCGPWGMWGGLWHLNAGAHSLPGEWAWELGNPSSSSGILMPCKKTQLYPSTSWSTTLPSVCLLCHSHLLAEQLTEIGGVINLVEAQSEGHMVESHLVLKAFLEIKRSKSFPQLHILPAKSHCFLKHTWAHLEQP